MISARGTERRREKEGEREREIKVSRDEVSNRVDGAFE